MAGERGLPAQPPALRVLQGPAHGQISVEAEAPESDESEALLTALLRQKPPPAQIGLPNPSWTFPLPLLRGLPGLIHSRGCWDRTAGRVETQQVTALTIAAAAPQPSSAAFATAKRLGKGPCHQLAAREKDGTSLSELEGLANSCSCQASRQDRSCGTGGDFHPEAKAKIRTRRTAVLFIQEASFPIQNIRSPVL